MPSILQINLLKNLLSKARSVLFLYHISLFHNVMLIGTAKKSLTLVSKDT